jgi:hypothetical protein
MACVPRGEGEAQCVDEERRSASLERGWVGLQRQYVGGEWGCMGAAWEPGSRPDSRYSECRITCACMYTCNYMCLYVTSTNTWQLPLQTCMYTCNYMRMYVLHVYVCTVIMYAQAMGFGHYGLAQYDEPEGKFMCVLYRRWTSGTTAWPGTTSQGPTLHIYLNTSLYISLCINTFIYVLVMDF